MTTTLARDYFDSLLGLMEIAANQQGLQHVIFCGPERQTLNANHFTQNCKNQLSEYFSLKRTVFDLPLAPIGTVFQRTVWQQLSQIGFGESCSYGELAHKLNNPKAVRAVGGANGRNPLTIIVPCHRVIGANGKLTGYAGGIERKLWLLQHEGLLIHAAQNKQQLEATIRQRQTKTQFLK